MAELSDREVLAEGSGLGKSFFSEARNAEAEHDFLGLLNSLLLSYNYPRTLLESLRHLH